MITSVVAIITLGAGLAVPAQPPESASRSVSISRTAEKVFLRSLDGRILREDGAGRDDAGIFQAAVEAVFPGGHIHIAAGRYVLARGITVDGVIDISGEGRHTTIVSPAGQFAFRLMQTKRSVSPRRELSAISVSNLAIDGENKGKGIYLSNLTQSWLRGLWIVRTGGAALYFDQSVMEMQISNLHISGTGSEENKEASIVIAGQIQGDANNNLHFDNVFVLGPNYVGLEIGGGPGRFPPRLVFLNHCMFHGWLPPREKPYDLILVRNLETQRGMVIRDTRLTNSGEDQAYVAVVRGEVKLFGNIFGGGRGRYFIRGEREARLGVSGNSFHSVDNHAGKPNYAVYVVGSELTFRENEVHPKVGPVWLAPASATLISENRFRNAAAGPPLRIGEGSKNVMVTGNFFYGRTPAEAVETAPVARKAVVLRDNVEVER